MWSAGGHARQGLSPTPTARHAKPIHRLAGVDDRRFGGAALAQSTAPNYTVTTATQCACDADLRGGRPTRWPTSPRIAKRWHPRDASATEPDAAGNLYRPGHRAGDRGQRSVRHTCSAQRLDVAHAAQGHPRWPRGAGAEYIRRPTRTIPVNRFLRRQDLRDRRAGFRNLVRGWRAYLYLAATCFQQSDDHRRSAARRGRPDAAATAPRTWRCCPPAWPIRWRRGSSTRRVPAPLHAVSSSKSGNISSSDNFHAAGLAVQIGRGFGELICQQIGSAGNAEFPAMVSDALTDCATYRVDGDHQLCGRQRLPQLY